MSSIVVGMVDFRRALSAVVPHADPDPEMISLHRVRCSVGTVNVAVSATQRYSVGNAIVSVEDNAFGDLVDFDLLPVEVKQILALFKPAKKGSGVDPMEAMLRLEVDEKMLTVTDISGLFPGKSLSLPRSPIDDFPDVQKLLMLRLSATPTKTARLVTAGHMLSLFTHAARAYAEPLVIEPATSKASMVISCGDSFVGLLMPVELDEEKANQIDGWHSDWLMRLGDDTGYVSRKDPS